jgi:acyl-homoserine-lactone acylase
VEDAAGDINRFQRLTGDIVQPFSDKGPSAGRLHLVAGARSRRSARGATRHEEDDGNTGNGFVAVVEFGDKVRAKAVSAGGESGDPKSKHFKDQAERYSTGNLREVYFYPEQLTGHRTPVSPQASNTTKCTKEPSARNARKTSFRVFREFS